MRVEVFPALFRKETVITPERIMIEGEAGCFYHPEKKAAVVCDACGRFLCSLCDVDLDGQHLCPSCLNADRQKGKIAKLQNSRTLYDRQAFVLAVLPFFITGLAALYYVIRYWKSPTGIASPQRWMMPLALTFAVLQIAAFVLLIVLSIIS